MSGALAFLAGFGTGYLNQTEKERDRARQEKLDKITFDKADRETETYDRDKKDRDTLQAAGAPVAVNSNAAMLGTSGQPALYEDAGVAGSDFRQARNMAEQTGVAFTDQAPTPAISVAGKQYQDIGAAKTAATAANAPEARSQRIIAAMSGIDPVKSLDLEHQQVSRGRETTKFTQEQADRQWQRDIGEAMPGGHEGLAALVSKSQGGPMAGVNLKATPSADGSTVTYTKTNADGTSEPTNLTFPNTQAGVIQAAYMLDKSISPAHRMDNIMKNTVEARLSKSADSVDKYHDALSAAAGVRADAAATKAEGGGKSPYERMPEDLRLQYSGHLKAAEKARDDVRKLEINNGGELTGAALVTADRYKKEAASYENKANLLLNQYRQPDATADKLGYRKPIATGAVGNATPAVQAARDVEAGDILMREYGGDLAEAQASANELAGEVKRAKGDAKAMLQSHLDRLNSGIRNASQSGAPPAVQARPPATVMAANSPVQVASKAPVAEIIPEPPPQFRQIGLQSMPNPLFAQWQQQYGQAYAAQQQAVQIASAQAATSAKSAFNPYPQNRVK